ncbi:thermostable hemolysin [Hahella sp. CR1]|uniref:thermostable hemolysin n=1 Tax=Hahella sp. CR1 TaxID=2992807 RepID=UPI002442D43E|nr:thermostable hemolysin [Hahella sp. CR1]MDG9666872.1 thermostable hemolysin [Hahella sp. CR1]
MQQPDTLPAPEATTAIDNRYIHVGPGHRSRAVAESFIRQRFDQEYGASIRYFMENFVLCYEQDRLISVLGYQSAQFRPLFLEQYLDAPIEQVLAQIQGAPCSRSGIIEVGNLASTTQGALRRLILVLGRYFSERKYQWLTLTVIPELLNSFRRFDLPMIELAKAKPEALSQDAADWGSYYDKSPTVMAISIPHGIHHLISNPVMAKVLERCPQPEHED